MAKRYRQYRLKGPGKRELTPRETADALHVSVSTLRRLIETGAFPPPIRMTPRSEPHFLAEDVAAYWHNKSRGMGPGVKPGKLPDPQGEADGEGGEEG